jgi:hypothetical protein
MSRRVGSKNRPTGIFYCVCCVRAISAGYGALLPQNMMINDASITQMNYTWNQKVLMTVSSGIRLMPVHSAALKFVYSAEWTRLDMSYSVTNIYGRFTHIPGHR